MVVDVDVPVEELVLVQRSVEDVVVEILEIYIDDKLCRKDECHPRVACNLLREGHVLGPSDSVRPQHRCPNDRVEDGNEKHEKHVVESDHPETEPEGPVHVIPSLGQVVLVDEIGVEHDEQGQRDRADHEHAVRDGRDVCTQHTERQIIVVHVDIVVRNPRVSEVLRVPECSEHSEQRDGDPACQRAQTAVFRNFRLEPHCRLWDFCLECLL